MSVNIRSAQNSLSLLQADTLREIANIGTGNAVTSLSTMTGETFLMSVPVISGVSLSRFEESLGDLESVAVAVYTPVSGATPGHVACFFPLESGYRLADMLLMQEPGTTQALDEMAFSALMEVCNVLVSSFLNALSDMTGLSLPIEPPGCAVDMTGAIMANLLTASPYLIDEAVVLRSRWENMPADPAFRTEGLLFFIPEPEALASLWEVLGLPELAEMQENAA